MKNIFFVLILFCFNIYQIKAIVNTEDSFKEKISSVFTINNDSIIKLKYDKIFKIYKDENYYLALEKALKLYDECKEEDNNYWTYKVLSLIADIYNKTNKFDESLTYHRKSLKLFNTSTLDKKEVRFSDLDFATNILRIGNTYQKLSLSILNYEKRSLRTQNNNQNSLILKGEKNKFIYLDSAKSYYKKLEKFPALNSEIESIKARAYNNLSGIYHNDSIYDKAEHYARKAIEIHKKNKDNLNKSISLNNLANINLSQEKYGKSKDIYFEAINLLKHNNNPKAIRVKASLYFNLAWAMRNLKDYEAYDFQEMYYDIEIGIREKEFSGKLEEVKYKYDFDAQLGDFEKQEEVKILKEKEKIKILIIIGIFLIVLFLFILRFYNLKQKNLALKLKQTELIQNQNIEKLKSESQVRILNATIDGKESERKQIAETLHDSVSALLSSANLHLQATRKQFNGSTPIEIDKTQEIILEASHTIRDLSHTLVSSILLKFGLNFAIKDVAEKYSNSELQIETEIGEVRRYHQSFEIKVHNIIQEFINNILKHSEANNALIELKEQNKKLVITISDDGLGFDKTKINMKDGLGINQIDARIKMMKGNFHIESSLNNGTKISIELPVLEKEEPNHV